MEMPIANCPAYALQLEDGRWQFTPFAAMGAVAVEGGVVDGEIVLSRQVGQAGEVIRGAEQVG